MEAIAEAVTATLDSLGAEVEVPWTVEVHPIEYLRSHLMARSPVYIDLNFFSLQLEPNEILSSPAKLVLPAQALQGNRPQPEAAGVHNAAFVEVQPG